MKDSLESVQESIVSYMELLSGLRAQSIHPKTWLKAIQARMEKLKMVDPQAYYQKLVSSRFESQELVEYLVVAETWFFRDRAAIDYLVSQLEQSQSPPVWKILSMACSTGEEPYSIAMALLERGIRPIRVAITGVDISRQALQIAEKGVYGKNSFRGKQFDYREHYFEGGEAFFELKSFVRHMVKFRAANIADPWFFLGGQRFQALFCRNVLVYLTKEAQEKTLALCKKLLEEDGLLFVGLSEVEMAKAAGFQPLGPAGACAFKRGKDDPQSASSGNRERLVRRQESEGALMLQHAAELANRGEVDAAMMACHRYLAQCPETADVYFLLGMLNVSSRRDQEARSCFQKAVYLEPSHYEGLVNLALIAERQGEEREAELLWKRARKIYQKTT